MMYFVHWGYEYPNGNDCRLTMFTSKEELLKFKEKFYENPLTHEGYVKKTFRVIKGVEWRLLADAPEPRSK